MIERRFRPIKVRTIIFTEACPLDCRYCSFKKDNTFGTKQDLTKEELFNLIADYDKQDDVNTVNTRILFSGGEPFLKWSWIKEIIEKYQHRFSYSFNTSGYLFTEEILEFLSHYEVDFNLSVDGNEALTNYLRPVVNTKYKTGYMKQFKKIVSNLLYYFPMTPFKAIVNARYVDLLYQTYCFANDLGFPYFSFILDFNNRKREIYNEKQKEAYLEWTDKHTKILQEQLDLIVQDITINFLMNKKRTQILEFNKIISFLFNEKNFSPENMQCQLFNNRSLLTLYNNNDNKEFEQYCLSGEFSDISVLRQELMSQYNSLNHQCLLDKDCPIFEYCCTTCCIQIGYLKNQQFFNFDELECIVIKNCYKAVLKLLDISNEFCKNSFLYQQYVLDMMKEGGNKIGDFSFNS